MSNNALSNKSPSFSNFFDLFELPVAFELDETKLNSRLLQLQSQFHPDKLGAKNSTSTKQNSAVINHAYDILKNEDSRANYLLELSGQELNTDNSIADLDFLDDAMDLRMALDEADSDNDVAKISALKSTVNQRIDSQSQRFVTAYSDLEWPIAMDATQKLKFLVKLKKDMDIAIDNSQQETDDDDLYL